MSWSPPGSAVIWPKSNRIQLYGLDPEGNIMVWGQKDQGFGYNGPSKVGFQAKPGTMVVAMVTNNAGFVQPAIHIFYYGNDNRYNEIIYTDETKWQKQPVLP